MVEYSSPNTNKPLHLGHLRNNFLGWSVAELYKACGYDIIKTCIANDRGIHICKSMVAWLQFANGATPESTGIKGDHFVGDYYVLFGNELKKQVDAGILNGLSKETAEKESPADESRSANAGGLGSRQSGGFKALEDDEQLGICRFRRYI